MIKLFSTTGRLLYRAGDNMVEHDGIEHAGYLTFLTMLSLFPFLVLIVAIAGFIGQGNVGTDFITYLLNTLPPEATAGIVPRIDEIISGPPQGLLTISILGAIWTASSLVEGMRTVLNRAYNVSNPPTYVLRRLLSILQLIMFTLIVIASMLALVFAPVVIIEIEHMLNIPFSEETTLAFNRTVVFVSAGLLFVIVASLYYFLPNIKQTLFAVLPGAALATLGWIAGTRMFSLYIQNVDQVNIIYGSLGSIIATLLFFFIMNIIFIYGAEFNYLLIRTRGEKVEEIEKGEKVKDFND